MDLNIEKAQELAGKQFRILPVSLRENLPNFREEFQTGYAFWMAFKGDIMSKKTEHKVGYWENNKFYSKPKFAARGYDETVWGDFEYEEAGKTKNYFEKKFIGRIEFKDPQTFSDVYNPETKKKGVSDVVEAFVTITPSLYGKIEKMYEDPRTKSYDFLKIVHTPSNPPATRYEVVFGSGGEPYPEDAKAAKTTTVAAAPRVRMFPHEAALITPVVGDEADLSTLVDYILTAAAEADITSMTDMRAQELAEGLLVDGIVTMP